MSSRAHRKALPLDHRGIHWGTGSSATPERHKSGTPWEPEEWKRFVAWACENDAQELDKGQCVAWCEYGNHHRESWWMNGKYHRENGPALIWADGHESWWRNGLRHRENGPAIVLPSGGEAWFLDGKRHRENGPARVWSDGHEEWWLNGRRYTDGTFTEPYST